MFAMHARTLPVDNTPQLEELIAGKTMEKGLITRAVARLETSVVTHGGLLSEVAGLSHKRILAKEKYLQLMSGAVQKVQICIGHPVELDTRFDAPTLWSFTSFIADEVIRLEGGLTVLEETVGPIKITVDNVMLECERLANLATGDKMLKVLIMVSNKVKEASEQIVISKTKVLELESNLAEAQSPDQKANSFKVTSPASVDAIDELIYMLDMGARVEERTDSFVTPEKAPRVGERTGGGREGELVRRLEEEIKRLTADVGLLKACSEDKSVKFGGLGLRSMK